jgi:RNA polymerase sigma-70 factor (ECF subfamily)
MEVDIQSWNALAPRLMGFIRKRVSERTTAQDIVQDVFLQFHQHSSRLRDPDKLAGWIFRVAQNRITDFFRDRKRKEVEIPMPTVEEENSYAQCVAECLKEEIRNLPEKYRLAFELAELKAVPQVKLASEMGVSYSGLKSRVQRARELLRVRMKAKYQIEYDRYGNILVCESRKGLTCPHPRG